MCVFECDSECVSKQYDCLKSFQWFCFRAKCNFYIEPFVDFVNRVRVCVCVGFEYHSDLVLQHLKALTVFSLCMIVYVYFFFFLVKPTTAIVQTASKEAVYLVGLTYFRLVSCFRQRRKSLKFWLFSLCVCVVLF